MEAKSIIKVILISLLSFIVTNANAQHRHDRGQRHAPNYHYSKMPRWGQSLNSVPKKSVVVIHSGSKYHYHSGVFYKPVGGAYKIVKAPIGIRVKVLPKGKIKFIHKGIKYFYYYGTFYTATSEGKEYIIVEPPLGAKVNALPEGYTEIKKNGNMYFEFEGVLYEEVAEKDNETWYKVVEVK